MAAPRRVIEISIADDDLVQLETIARSRTEPACRVVRARILLAYHTDPSAYAVSQAIGVTHQTVQRCLDRAVRLGAVAALDDSPRPGRAPEITNDAKAWLVSLACQKAKDLGYPHELLDHAVARAPYPRARCGSRTSLPAKHRPRHGLQNSRPS
jgi:hypothetical protein